MPLQSDAQPRSWSMHLVSGMLLASLAGCATPPNIPPAPADPGTVGAAATSGGPAGSGAGHAPAPPPDLAVLRPAVRDHYRTHLGDGGTLYQFDPAHSDLRIYAFRAGAGARFGHNHVLSAPHFSGLAWAPAKGGLHGASADLGFRLSELAVDPPALRAATGGGFGQPLDADAVRGTTDHLLGDQGFQATSFPWVEISAIIEAGELPVAVADVALTLHGETHHQRVALKVQADTRQIEVTGMLAFRQGDYGLKPYSVLGGVLAVDDLVAIEFRLRGAPLPPGVLTAR